MTREQFLILALSLCTIAATVIVWLKTDNADLGRYARRVLGANAAHLLGQVEARLDARIRAGMAQLTDEEIARLLAGESVYEPPGPRDFVVVERRGRGDYATFEPNDGGRVA